MCHRAKTSEREFWWEWARGLVVTGSATTAARHVHPADITPADMREERVLWERKEVEILIRDIHGEMGKRYLKLTGNLFVGPSWGPGGASVHRMISS
nr:hypothetical protein CFP56_19344 [Quercus suber]